MLWKIFYQLIVYYLPESSEYFSFGKRLRAICAKRIMKYCSKNVNIERRSLWSNKIMLGDRSGIGKTEFSRNQKILLKMLDFVNCFCDKNNIHYWTNSGTLLGQSDTKSIFQGMMI